MPPSTVERRVVKGQMMLNAESAGKPLPNRLAFGNAAVVNHADGTLTGLIFPGMRRVTVIVPNGYFVDTGARISDHPGHTRMNFSPRFGRKRIARIDVFAPS